VASREETRKVEKQSLEEDVAWTISLLKFIPIDMPSNSYALFPKVFRKS
jgi:hypothetical protein